MKLTATVPSILEEVRILRAQEDRLASGALSPVEAWSTHGAMAEARVSLGFLFEDDPRGFEAALQEVSPADRDYVYAKTYPSLPGAQASGICLSA